MNKRFLDFLLEVDLENFEYRVDKEFEAETGIRGKRFQTILKTGGADASYTEMQSLLRYYSKKTDKNLTPDDLFGGDDATKQEKPKPPTLKPKTGKAKDLDDIFDNF
jgi:hypothetical protein